MTTRPCEFCEHWTQEFIEENEAVCGACNNTRELDNRDCFCYAYVSSECGCNANWTDEEDY